MNLHESQNFSRDVVAELKRLRLERGISQNALAAKAGVSRAVIVLEKKALIRRQTDPRDSRRQLLFLTEAGRALYARYIPVLQAREAAMLACLSAAERRQLDGLLDKLAAHVPAWAGVSEL